MHVIPGVHQNPAASSPSLRVKASRTTRQTLATRAFHPHWHNPCKTCRAIVIAQTNTSARGTFIMKRRSLLKFGSMSGALALAGQLPLTKAQAAQTGDSGPIKVGILH